MNTISCDVCLDLIPLVQDDAASEDSKKLVSEHTSMCPQCRRALQAKITADTPDDMIALKRMRRHVALRLVIFAFVGILIGLSIPINENFAYNLILMPLLGCMVLFFGGSKWYLIPPAIFCITTLGKTIFYTVTPPGIPFFHALYYSTLIGLALALLCFAGCAVAALFKYAFTKETPHEN